MHPVPEVDGPCVSLLKIHIVNCGREKDETPTLPRDISLHSEGIEILTYQLRNDTIVN